jgi:peptide/nickel transport system permease protein
MFRYVLRRVFWAIPTLWVVSLLIFGLSQLSPRDPVRDLYGDEGGLSNDPVQQARLYAANAANLGLDKASFYFSIQPGCLSDTMHRIFPPERRMRLRALAIESGAWGPTAAYDKALNEWLLALNRMPDTLAPSTALRLQGNILWRASTVDEVLQVAQQAEPLTAIYDEQQRLLVAANALRESAIERNPWPVRWVWHGADNQYHHWLSGFLRGELGRSVVTRRPVGRALYAALCVTLTINGVAMLLAFGISIPLGTFLARRKDAWPDRLGQTLLLAVYTMPAFWLGTVLILMFATPGMGFHWLSGSSIKPWASDTEPFTSWLMRNGSHLVLPVLTLSLHVVALLALQMRSSVVRILSLPFLRTAYAKGMPEATVVWRHGVRNALFPMIALLAQVLPAIFGGALVLEYLFQVPGMGSMTQEAFLGRDFPVLFAITMLSAGVTIAANLLADVLYAWLDPRVRF